MVKCHVVILGCLLIIGYNLYDIKCDIYEVPDSSLIMRCHVVTRNIDGVPGNLFIVECHVVILECQLVFYSEVPCSNT